MTKYIVKLAYLFVLATAYIGWSQPVNGTISGRITAPDGAALPNAAVTIVNVSTNASQNVLTDPDGSFVIAGLPPGAYRIEVALTGYKRASRQNVELTSAGPGTINITLERGNSSESVAISANAPVVQANGGEISTVFGTRTVRELPIVDRNHQQLAGLQSGVTPPAPVLDPVVDPQRNRYFATNGQEPWNRQFGMDGVNNLEPFRNTAIRVQPLETLQEMRTSTASHSMDKGFTGGAAIMNITGSGTNGVHGSLFEFYSGNVLRTRPFFSASDPPRYVHNQMGATLGGAIIPDRTFLFGSYEGTFDNGSNALLTTVPTPQAVAGNFTGIPGITLYNPNTGNPTGAGRTPFSTGIIPPSQINPTAAAIASFIPAPNLPGFVNNYVAAVPFQNHANKADARLDQHFGDRTSLFLRYGFTNNWIHSGSPLGDVIGSGTRDRLLNHNAAIGLEHALTSALLTDFRFGYNRWDQKLGTWGSRTPLAGALGLSNLDNLVGINIAGFTPIGTPATLPANPVDNNFNWAWNWSWRRGMHDVKWGTDIRRYRVDGFTDTLWGSIFGPSGTAYFGPGATMSSTGPALAANSGFYNSFGSFLLGAPSQVGISNYFVRPTIRQTQYSFWLGDTIRVYNHVTLDLGVRYEVYSPLEPAHSGGAAFFDPATNSFSYAGIGGRSARFADYDWNNVAPRIGIAFQPMQRTVLRAGYSINYFQPPYMLSGLMAPAFGATTGVPGGFTTAQIQGRFGPTLSSTNTAPSTLQNGASAGNLPAAVFSPNAVTPYVQSFNAQLQQEFAHGLVLSLGYVGALDRHLPYVRELNAAAPGTGVAGLPFFAGFGRTASTLDYNSGLTSNYNSLQVNLSERFSAGLSFQASYTWGKALGYTSGNGLLLNPFNLRSNYGPLDFDRQHVLSISHVWELPFGLHGNNIVASIVGGWQLNGVFTWSTGTPLTVTADPLGCACPGNIVLANLNGSPYLSDAGIAYLNQAAFSAPASGQFGNLGRGALRGPDNWNYDLSLFKNFRVRDRFKAEIRGEAYNLTNTTHFANPVTNINSPGFGQTVMPVNGFFGRQINLGLRMTF